MAFFETPIKQSQTQVAETQGKITERTRRILVALSNRSARIFLRWTPPSSRSKTRYRLNRMRQNARSLKPNCPHSIKDPRDGQ